MHWPTLFAFMAVIIWGWTYLLLEDLLKKFRPSQLIVFRYGGALALSIPLLALGPRFFPSLTFPAEKSGSRAQRSVTLANNRAILRQRTPDEVMQYRIAWIYALLAGASLAGATATQKYGITLLKQDHAATKAAFYIALIPAFSAILMLITQQHTHQRYVLVPILLCAVGAGHLSQTRFSSGGDLLEVIAALFYALQMSFIQKAEHVLEPVCVFSATCAVCALAGILLYYTFDRRSFVVPLRSDYVGLLSLLFFSTFLAWVLVYGALRPAEAFQHITALRLSLIYTTEPVFTLILGILTRKQTLNRWEIPGYMLILAGNILAAF